MSGIIVIEESTRESIRALMASGNFATEQEVIAQGLRLLEAQEKRRIALHDSLAHAIADLEAGRIIPVEEVFSSIREKLKARSN